MFILDIRNKKFHLKNHTKNEEGSADLTQEGLVELFQRLGWNSGLPLTMSSGVTFPEEGSIPEGLDLDGLDGLIQKAVKALTVLEWVPILKGSIYRLKVSGVETVGDLIWTREGFVFSLCGDDKAVWVLVPTLAQAQQTLEDFCLGKIPEEDRESRGLQRVA